MNIPPSVRRHGLMLLAMLPLATVLSGCLIVEERRTVRGPYRTYDRGHHHHRSGYYDHRRPYDDRYRDGRYYDRVNRYESSRYRNDRYDDRRSSTIIVR